MIKWKIKVWSWFFLFLILFDWVVVEARDPTLTWKQSLYTIVGIEVMVGIGTMVMYYLEKYLKNR